MTNGIYPRTEEHNKHISESKKLYYSSPENVEKHRQASLNYERKIYNQDNINPVIKIKGVIYYSFPCIDCGNLHYTQKIKGNPKNPRCWSCAAIIRGTGRICKKETKDKIAKSLMGHPISDKVRMNNKSVAQREKISKSVKVLWSNRDYAIRNRQGCNIKPNKPEKALSYIIRKVSPHKFKYNGDGRLGVALAGRIPDFVNVNGKKQVIELFGEYWHGEKRTQRTKEQETERLISHYKKLGYSCLIIWEFDLKNKDNVKNIIKEFAEA